MERLPAVVLLLLIFVWPLLVLYAVGYWIWDKVQGR